MNLYKLFLLLLLAVALTIFTFGCNYQKYGARQTTTVVSLPCNVVIHTEVFERPPTYRYGNDKTLWSKVDTVCYDKVEVVKGVREREAEEMLNVLNPKEN